MTAGEGQVLMLCHIRPAHGVIVKFGHHDIAVLDRAQNVAGIDIAVYRALPDEDFRLAFRLFQQLHGAYFGDDINAGNAAQGGHGAPDAHIIHSADRAQHHGLQQHPFRWRALDAAQDILQGTGALGELIGLDTEGGQGRGYCSDESVMPLGHDIAWPDFAGLDTGLTQQIDHIAEAEPADMGAVEQPLILEFEPFGHQGLQHLPVLHIRDTGEHGAVGGEQLDKPAHGCPWIAQMFQHIAENHGIERCLGQDAFRDIVGIGVEQLDQINPLGSDFCGGGVKLQPGIEYVRHPHPKCLGQRPGTTTQFQHLASGQREAVQQIGIGPVIIRPDRLVR